MEQPDEVQKKIEALTLQYGADLVREALPKMTDGNWQNYTTPAKVFYLYMIAEQHARRDVLKNQEPTGDGLERISPRLIQGAIANLIGLPATI